MKLDIILQKFGLTPKEASLYLAALELGSASVQKIANKAGVVRSTTYEILEKLRLQGLITTFLKKKVRYYSAEDPRQVLHWAQSRVETLKEAMPELEILSRKSRRRPTVRFYEGKEGMGLILKEIITEADNIVCFASVEDYFNELGEYHKNFLDARIKYKIPLRVILRESEKARERQRLGPKELRVVKLVPDAPSFHGLTYIWKNKIAMFSFVDDFVAIVIDSRELAAMQMAMFNHLWNKVDGRLTGL